MSIQSVNPATGETLATFPETSDRDIERILANSQAAFGGWRTLPFTVRAERMRAAARVLRARTTEYARAMTLEMG